MKKKLISMLLTLCMILTLLPTAALAASSQTPSYATDKLSVTINGTTTYYDDHAEGWNAATGAENTTGAIVKLLADWTATFVAASSGNPEDNTTSFGTGIGFFKGTSATGTGNLCVPLKKTVTLDLNGFTLDRANPISANDGCVIRVKGNLTLQDTKGTGKITGGYDGAAGGIIVNNAGNNHTTTGQFTMTGGNITGNKGGLSSGFTNGSGVFADTDTILTITGGSITGNTDGAGVFINQYVEFSVGGTAKITGNMSNTTPCNVSPGNSVMHVTTPLTAGASIGVTIPSSSSSLVSVPVTSDNNTDYSRYFQSDSDAYKVVNTGANDKQVVQLEKKPSVTDPLDFSDVPNDIDCSTATFDAHDHNGDPVCWSWKQSTKTLTFTGAYVSVYSSVGITLPDGATLFLNGRNVVHCPLEPGIVSKGNLTITSDSATSTLITSTKVAIHTEGDLTISGANTEVNARSYFNHSISSVTGVIILNGAKNVTSTAGADKTPFNKAPILTNMTLQSGSGAWDNTTGAACVYVYEAPTSSGGGGDSSPSYSVTNTTPKTENGSVTFNTRSAQSGEIVKLTVKADTGYQLDTLTVKDAKGNTIETTKNADGTYRFKMPASKVTVEATFKAVEKPWVNPFTDVTEGDWCYDAVKFANEKGLFSGITDATFAPNATTTRAMLWTVLARQSGQDVSGGESWYEKAQEWATEQGISDGTNPAGEITREQLSTMLWRLSGSPMLADYPGLSTFGDAGYIASYAQQAMAWAHQQGLVQGTDGKLMPTSNATRAQVATIMMRYCEHTAK